MSPRARLAAALTLSALVCLMGVVASSAAAIHGRLVPSLTSADLDASSANWAEESDQEDSDSVHPTRSLGAPATFGTVDPMSAERTRRLRLDRPPEVDHLS